MATPEFTLASLRPCWHPSLFPCHPLLASLRSAATVAAVCSDALFSRPVNSQLIMNECVVTVPAAFMHVRDNIEELGKVADDTDLLFLKGLLDSPVVTSLVKVSAPFISKSK